MLPNLTQAHGLQNADEAVWLPAAAAFASAVAVMVLLVLVCEPPFPHDKTESSPDSTCALRSPRHTRLINV